jgi:hypothetical protein
MNIQKIGCIDCSTGGPPTTYEVLTKDLSAEEFAELRFLVDLSRILEGREPGAQQFNTRFVTVIVETKDGHFKKTYTDELGDEIKELIECIKQLSKLHANPLQIKSA